MTSRKEPISYNGNTVCAFYLSAPGKEFTFNSTRLLSDAIEQGSRPSHIHSQKALTSHFTHHLRVYNRQCQHLQISPSPLPSRQPMTIPQAQPPKIPHLPLDVLPVP